MPDNFKSLTAEYEMLMAAPGGSVAGESLETAIRHILRRLGPPSLTEASEIERREAIAADE